MASKQLTKYDKDRIKSRVSSLWLEMRTALTKDMWDEVGREDTVRRVVSMNCAYHGFDEKRLRAQPDIMQVECRGVKLMTRTRDQLATPLRRPMKLPVTLLFANIRSHGNGDVSLSALAKADGIVTEAMLLLPDPAGEMIGPAYGTLLACLREQGVMQSDAQRFNKHVKAALDQSKSLIALCSVFPVLRHFITPEQEAELPMDLTKARGDVHKIARGVDMGDMIQLSMKINAYMGRRVIKKED